MTGGASVDDTLRAEVHDAELLIGLITPTSLESAYVMFELGARWGAGKPMIPLLASGATPSHLGGPLAGINALDASQTGQLHQLLGDVAGHLSITLDQPSSYTDAIEELATRSAIPSTLEQRTANDATSQLSEDAKELLIEATKDRYGLILVARMNVGKIIQTHRKQFGEQGDRRSEARWEQAISDLWQLELIQDASGSGQSYEVTDKGFQIADELARQG